VFIELLSKKHNLIQIIRISNEPKIKPTRHQKPNRNDPSYFIIFRINKNPGQSHHNISDTTTKSECHCRQQPISQNIHGKKHQTDNMVCGHFYKRLFFQPAQKRLSYAVEMVA
jgi:hypothetical protein